MGEDSKVEKRVWSGPGRGSGTNQTPGESMFHSFNDIKEREKDLRYVKMYDPFKCMIIIS